MDAAAACSGRVRELLGGELPRDAGVLHVVSAWRAPTGPPLVLRIGPRTPSSDTDRFVLGLARARADAILTTGRNLREEPGNTHALPGRWRAELAAWRREVLGRSEPPTSLVLTSARELDLDHRLFRRAARPVVFTTRAAAARLEGDARPRGIELVGSAAPSLRAALAWLRHERGARTLAVEAGPSTARELYSEPLAVDELMLSLFEEPDLPADVRGEPLLPLESLERLLPHGSAPREVREPSGRWSFQRLWRADVGAAAG